MITRLKGRGPSCPECGVLPKKIEEVSTPPGIDYGQGRKYRCNDCGEEFVALRRRFYNAKGEQVRSPGDKG